MDDDADEAEEAELARRTEELKLKYDREIAELKKKYEDEKKTNAELGDAIRNANSELEATSSAIKHPIEWPTSRTGPIPISSIKSFTHSAIEPIVS